MLGSKPDGGGVGNGGRLPPREPREPELKPEQKLRSCSFLGTAGCGAGGGQVSLGSKGRVGFFELTLESGPGGEAVL